MDYKLVLDSISSGDDPRFTSKLSIGLRAECRENWSFGCCKQV